MVGVGGGGARGGGGGGGGGGLRSKRPSVISDLSWRQDTENVWTALSHGHWHGHGCIPARSQRGYH